MNQGLQTNNQSLGAAGTEQSHSQQVLLERERALAMLQERERLARELYDSLGQILSYVKFQVQAARLLLAQGKEAAADSELSRLVAVNTGWACRRD